MPEKLYTKEELDVTGSNYVIRDGQRIYGHRDVVVFSSEPSSAVLEGLHRKGMGAEWSNTDMNVVEMQRLLNRYQYDEKAYLRACAKAGLDPVKARAFSQETYALIDGSGINLPSRPVFLMLLLVAVLVTLPFIVMYFRMNGNG